ncbi:MAG: 3-hydroxyacyl-CoA dehydrogenase family protein [bacterium]|nr:3-hydroxyacyl-CoA dehydrogenase family protein [bacterium]
MNIAALGSPKQLEELNLIFSSASCSFTVLENTKNISTTSFDLIFDLNFDNNPDSINEYIGIHSKCILCLSAVKIQLHQAIPKTLQAQVVGINALPTFLSRPLLEVCTLSNNIDFEIFKTLGWKSISIVESRIGMVSARIICMIINEAYFTLQEGTANRADIDKGMKLGTAYPHGPFEWCEKIGIANVFDLLNGMANDTHDERYKICSLLKTEYLIATNN